MFPCSNFSLLSCQYLKKNDAFNCLKKKKNWERTIESQCTQKIKLSFWVLTSIHPYENSDRFLSSEGVDWCFNPSWALHHKSRWYTCQIALIIGHPNLTYEEILTRISHLERIPKVCPFCFLFSEWGVFVSFSSFLFADQLSKNLNHTTVICKIS